MCVCVVGRSLRLWEPLQRYNGTLIRGENRLRACRISPVNIFLGRDSLTQIEPSLHGLARLVSKGGVVGVEG